MPYTVVVQLGGTTLVDKRRPEENWRHSALSLAGKQMFVGPGTHDISRGYRCKAWLQYTVKRFAIQNSGNCFLPTLYTLVLCCHAWIFASSPFCFHLRASRRGNYNRITSVEGGQSASQRGTTCLRTECWRNSAVLSASRQQQATIM